MLKRVSLRGVVGIASSLGVLAPVTLLVRTRLFPMPLFGVLELLLYPGSIFLFDESPHSALFGVAMLAFSIIATIALYALAAMILYGIFRGVVGAYGSFCSDMDASHQSMKPTALSRNKFSVFATTPCRGSSRSR